MIVVLDASSAVTQALYPTEPESILHYEIIQKADLILSPDLFISEITNALWKYCLHKKIDVRSAKKYGKYSISLVDHFIETYTLWREALSMATDLSHSVYDCMYLVLAKKNKATVLTYDKKLIKLAQSENINIS